MERDIMVEVWLHEKFDGFVIKKLLDKTLSVNIKIYSNINIKDFSDTSIEIETVVQKIINNQDEPRTVFCRFEDTRFYLFFHEAGDGSCKFGVLLTHYPWKKAFENGKEIVGFDMARYVRLMMRLAKGLKIKMLHARVETI